MRIFNYHNGSLSFIAGLLVITGCGYVGVTGNTTVSPGTRQSANVSNMQQSTRPSVESREQALRVEARTWHGTPHRLGGESRRGIDCSALAQQVFAALYNVDLPRTTLEQSRKGKSVGSLDDLIAGDLIFFRIGNGKRHMGIYVGDGEFFHASASQGVTISPLAGDYWMDRLWKMRRVLPEVKTAIAAEKSSNTRGSMRSW